MDSENVCVFTDLEFSTNALQLYVCEMHNGGLIFLIMVHMLAVLTLYTVHTQSTNVCMWSGHNLVHYRHIIRRS